MKLFTRYNRINLLATAIIFLLSGLAYYFLLRYILIGQVDDDLKIEQREIKTYVDKYNRLPEVIPVKDQLISYVLLERNNGEKKFETRLLSDDDDREEEVFRTFIFDINAGGKWYRVSVSKSLEGTDDMIQSIITITLVTILLILMVSLLVNRVVLRRLWKPFYDSLQSMQNFDLGKKELPQFPATNIDEFVFMNKTLQQVTIKAEQDYRLLKEFTENASHELQTPLAIIQSKLDLLIQDEHLSELQSRAVQSAYEAIQKLSRLNQSLLLLAKIENGQYTELGEINLSKRITAKLEQLDEMIQSKDITIKKELDETVFITMNPILADILLNNLLGNAIKYNAVGGSITLTVKNGLFTISNPGINGALDNERIFRRFGKTGQVKDGLGLGLAIVKQVADISGLTTSYTWQNGLHTFSFKW
jgi:signal transduction histidine kinase